MWQIQHTLTIPKPSSTSASISAPALGQHSNIVFVLVLLVGIPASGKSTFARQLVTHIKKQFDATDTPAVPTSSSSAEDDTLGSSVVTFVGVDVIETDAIFAQNAHEDSSDDSKRDEPRESWQLARSMAFQQIRQIFNKYAEIIPTTPEKCRPSCSMSSSASSAAAASDPSSPASCGPSFSSCSLLTSSVHIRAHVLLVDDTNIHASHRLWWFHVAREAECAYMEIYFSCPLPLALKRNDERKEHRAKQLNRETQTGTLTHLVDAVNAMDFVDNGTIEKMHHILSEANDDHGAKSCKASHSHIRSTTLRAMCPALTLLVNEANTESGVLEQFPWSYFFDVILHYRAPKLTANDDELNAIAAAAASRKVNAASAVHQADIQLRKRISTLMHKMKAGRTDSVGVAQPATEHVTLAKTAAQLNGLRKEILSALTIVMETLQHGERVEQKTSRFSVGVKQSDDTASRSKWIENELLGLIRMQVHTEPTDSLSFAQSVDSMDNTSSAASCAPHPRASHFSGVADNQTNSVQFLRLFVAAADFLLHELYTKANSPHAQSASLISSVSAATVSLNSEPQLRTSCDLEK